MISDLHTHTSFSGDSNADMEKVIKRAIDLNMPYLAITDHNDFLIEAHRFELDFEGYYKKMLELQEKYSDKIDIIIGLEQGLDKRFTKETMVVTSDYDFDFIIGSSHIVNGTDPYFPEYFADRSTYDAMVEYFESVLENLNIFDNFDVYGHLDYALRYAPDGTRTYEYSTYKELLDEILKTIISKGKGLELNTSNLRKNIPYTNPGLAVLKRYRELGGEIITVGSDSHTDGKAGVGFGFDTARNMLLECGFNHYNVFKKRCLISLDL